MSVPWDLVLGNIAEQIIPVFVAVTGAVSKVITKVFVRDRVFLDRDGHYLSYILTGQAVLVCPLSALIAIASVTVGSLMTSIHLAVGAVYLAIYIGSVALYLSMTADQFDNMRRKLRLAYKLVPLILMLLSLGVKLSWTISKATKGTP